jgi:hypothetical protein
MKINKRFPFIISSLIFLSGSILPILFSCSKDEDTDDTPVIEKPVITLTNPDTSYLSCSASQTILIDLNAGSNSSSGQPLSQLLITSKFGNNQPITVLDSTLSGSSFAMIDYPITSNSQTGTELWTFKITDNAGQFGEVILYFANLSTPFNNIKNRYTAGFRIALY